MACNIKREECWKCFINDRYSFLISFSRYCIFFKEQCRFSPLVDMPKPMGVYSYTQNISFYLIVVGITPQPVSVSVCVTASWFPLLFCLSDCQLYDCLSCFVCVTVSSLIPFLVLSVWYLSISLPLPLSVSVLSVATGVPIFVTGMNRPEKNPHCSSGNQTPDHPALKTDASTTSPTRRLTARTINMKMTVMGVYMNLKRRRDSVPYLRVWGQRTRHGYLTFSRRFRRVVVNMLKKKVNSCRVSPTQYVLLVREEGLEGRGVGGYEVVVIWFLRPQTWLWVWMSGLPSSKYVFKYRCHCFCYVGDGNAD